MRTPILFLAGAAGCFLLPVPGRLLADTPAAQSLFVSGHEGYGRFRIPALVVSPRGTLLAFCEGRHRAAGLTGDIDMVLKRSLDHGRTWQPLQVVADDGGNTLGNPCPVADRSTGTIWLPFTRSLGTDTEEQIVAGRSKDPTRVWLTHSSDDGATWARPVDITAAVKKPDWTWYGTGPGAGIQLKNGRLVVPSYHAVAGTKAYVSHMIYSDDHGKTWKPGGDVGDRTSECQVVEARDGTLAVNARTVYGGTHRTVGTSRDGGQTWQDVRPDERLPDAGCQGCVAAGPGEPAPWLYTNVSGPKRRNLALRTSLDHGKTWSAPRLLAAGHAAYSSLAVLPDHSVGCLFERGKRAYHDEVALVRFPLSWALSPEKGSPTGYETMVLLDKLRSAPESAGPPELRAAWDRVVQLGTAVLPLLLEAIDTPNTPGANWLCAAFDRITAPALQSGGKGLDLGLLLSFARDTQRQGRTRRLALDTAERIKPGTRDAVIRDRLTDPEFGYDAIGLHLAELARRKDLPKEEALAAYRKLLDAATDVGQAQAVAARLKELGTTVSLAAVFGFPREWYLLGPFDGGGKKSFHTVYPPEEKVDLKAEYPGKDGKPIRWQRVTLAEQSGGTYPAMADLRKPLGEVDDAAGFAYTVIELPAAREVEFRVAADDNLQVWVNGRRVFAFEEWTNGMRLDRHRFKAPLRAGANTVLVKVCQGKGDANTPDTTWQFVLRLCDSTGRGVPFRTALPPEKR